MRRETAVIGSFLALALCAAPAQSENREASPSGATEQRELIYCADQMTHDEREAHRARMRAARTQAEKAALRQSHRQEMQLRARQRGLDVTECEPLRLRVRGGQAR